MAGETLSRVLKFGLVQDGKLIEEGILEEKQGITLGYDATNTISVTGDNMPRKHRLVEPSGNGFKLNVIPDVEGKVAVGNAVTDIKDLIQSGAAVQKGNFYEIKLDLTSKGKLSIGKSTILFQLIPPPAAQQPVLKLPKELRSGFVQSFDWFFLAVIILSMAFHIGVASYLNTLEVSESINKDVQNRFFDKVTAAEVEAVIEEDAPEDENLDDKPKAGGGGTKGGGGGDEEKGVESKGVLALITKTGGPGGSVADIIGEGSGVMDAIAGLGDGVTVASSGNIGGLGSGPRTGAGGDGTGGAVGLDKIGSVGGSKSAGSLKETKKQVKAAISQAAGGVSGNIDASSVRAVISGRLGGVRYCYEQQLKTNPALQGKVRVSFVIGGSGSVAGCSVSSDTTGNALVSQCVCRMVSRWKFPAPSDGGNVTVTHTFVFSPAS